MQRYTLLVTILLVSAFGRSSPVAQTEGRAEISRPGSGDSVFGVVTILGSASSTSFDHYELSFGYDPDPTQTWFPIGEPVSTQVSFGRLGLWDTSRITDGNYALRLTVTLKDGTVLEDVVGGIAVRRSASGGGARAGTTTPSVEPTVEGPITGSATATAAREATPTTADGQPPTRGRGIDVGGIVLLGAGGGAMGLLGLAAYVRIRRSLRQRWAAIRSRRLHTGSHAEGRRGSRQR